MIVVRDTSTISHISSPSIRSLVQRRIDDLGGDRFDSAALGYFMVIEAGDSLEDIQAQIGFDIVRNRHTGIRYDQAGFTPSFEFVEAFPACYDMVIVLGDDGNGIEVFVPIEQGVPTELLSMCRDHAFPSEDGDPL